MVPTEAQMKLAIAQILSMPFAYNSPVIVLDFDLGSKDAEKITGRFKDLARPRVFSFEINRKSVIYKPFVARIDSDGINFERWEEFSRGFCYRFDNQSIKKEKAQCVKPTSYNCGSICINIKKNCKANAEDSFSKERIGKLFKLKKLYLDELYNTSPSKEREADLMQKNKEISLLLKPYQERVKETELQKKQQIEEQRKRQVEALKNEAKGKRDLLIKMSDELAGDFNTPGDVKLEVLTNLLYNDPTVRVVQALKKDGSQEASLLSKQELDLAVKVKEKTDTILENARRLIEVEEPTKISTSYHPDNKTDPSEYQEGIDRLSKMISVPSLNEVLKVKETEKGRSFYDGVSVNMGTTDPGAIVHEAGHWLESRNLQVRKEVKEFYDKRTQGETPVKLSQITGNKAYGDGEVTKVDKWLNPYIGKVYPDASEVLSVGLELMHRNPVYLAKNDPDMFDFIYTVVRQG